NLVFILPTSASSRKLYVRLRLLVTLRSRLPRRKGTKKINSSSALSAGSSDSWDCTKRSSHRKPFAVPAGVNGPSLSTTTIIVVVFTKIRNHIYSGGNTWRLLGELRPR